MKNNSNKLRDITIFHAGEHVDAVAEYEAEFEAGDPSVGYQGGCNITLVRLVTEEHGLVVDLKTMDRKERQRIIDRLADSETDELESPAERRQAAAEDRWDAKRHGD
jgi:hypothetical protein